MIRNRIIVLMMTIVLLTMTLPPFLPDISVEGSVTKLDNGDLIVDGSSYTIDVKGEYTHEGNITVKGANGVLYILNTELKILTPNYQRNIYVKDGGKLILYNSTITTSLDTFNFYESLNIEVTNNGLFSMSYSRIECDGWLMANNGNIEIRNSVITKNTNINGNNDTCVDINLQGSSDMLITDSDIEEYESRYPSQSYIVVNGTSILTAINSYIDINYGTSGWSRLKMLGNSKAYLYGITTDGPANFPPAASAIEIPSVNAFVEIHKWVNIQVWDAASIPVGGAIVTVSNLTDPQPVGPPRTEALAYIGKNSSDWNVSDRNGNLMFPLRTNILSYGNPYPTNNFTGTYKLTGVVPSFASTAEAYISFTSYPRLLADENSIDVNLTFDKVVPPDLNKYFSSGPSVYIYGNTKFTKPVQVQENIIIDGGTLTLENMDLKLSQNMGDKFYLLIKNDGSLIVDNSKIWDIKREFNYYIFNYGSTINANNADFDIKGSLSVLEGGDVNFDETIADGVFYVSHYDSNITITDDSMLNGTRVVLDYANVEISESMINASNEISIDDITLNAINSTFSRGVTFNGNTVAYLINVGLPASSVTQNAIVYVGWWLTTNVTDGGNNPVSGAMLNIYNYTVPSGNLALYSSGLTDNNGQVISKVIGEIVTSAGPYSGIERSYYLNATYKGLISSPTGFSSPMTNVQEFVKFDYKPDLKPTKVEIEGDEIEGKPIIFNATISNGGTFEARDIAVRFIVNDQQISEDKVISFIDKSSRDYVTAEWLAQLGSYPVKIVVDPMDKIGESDETNNNYTSKVDIETGAPDIYITTNLISFNPAKPIKGQTVNISVALGNSGDTDPLHFGNKVYVDLYLGDPAFGGTKIGDTQVLTSVEEGGFSMVYAELQFDEKGKYLIWANASTALDSDINNNIALAEFTVYDFADLRITTSDISFDPSGAVAKDTDVTIQVKVRNFGESTAHDVKVDFYEGDPAGAESTYLGNETAEMVLPGANNYEIVEFVYSPASTGNHEIYVFIDSINTTIELSELNNVAMNTIYVKKPADLVVSADSIVIFSSEPNHPIRGEMVTLVAEVENTGETIAYDFEVHFFYKSTLNQIGSVKVSELIPSNKTTVEITWSPTEVGTFNFIIWADALSAVDEIDEENNNNVKGIRIYSKPDLTLDPEDLLTDITSVPPVVTYSQKVALTATVRNRGESDSASFWVQFFDGDPSKGGLLIGVNKRIDGIVAGDLTSVEIEWTAIPGGDHRIYFLIDPFDEVEERDETDNSQSIDIYVETVPDLVITKADIDILAGDYGRIDEPTEVNVTINNIGDTDSDSFSVNFYNGDPEHDKTFSLIQSVTMDGIAGGSSDYSKITWTPTTFGMQKVFVWIDEDEQIFELREDNNIEGRTFEVLQIAPDLKITPTDVKILEGETVTTKLKTTIDYTLSLTIFNVGNEDVSDFNISVAYTVTSGTTEKTGFIGDENQQVGAVSSNESITYTMPWRPTVAGDYVFEVTLDSLSQHREFNEADNIIETQTYNVQVLPNIFIADESQDITISKYDPIIGEMVTITITVTVTGDHELTSIPVELIVNGDLVQPQPQAGSIVDGKATITYGWTPDAEGSPVLKFTFDPTGPDDNIGQLREAKEDDNEVVITAIYVEGGAAADADDKESNTLLFLIIIIVVVVVIVILLLILRRRKAKEPIECPECGEMVPAGETECPECGTEILPPPEEVECAKCGAVMTTEDEKCPECGEINEAYEPPLPKMGEPGVAAAGAPPPAAPAPPPKRGKKKKAAPPPAAGPAPAPVPEPVAAPGMEGEEMEEQFMPGPEIEGVEGAAGETEEGEAECYKCGARVPLSVPKCPVCGADFE